MATLSVLKVADERLVERNASIRFECPVTCIIEAARRAHLPLPEGVAESIYGAMLTNYYERAEALGGEAPPPFTVFVLNEKGKPFTSGVWCPVGVNDETPEHTLRAVVHLEREEY